MFGDFKQNFGIPDLNAFPFQGMDAQGGLLGANAPEQPLIGSQPVGPQDPAQQGSPASGVGGPTPSPTAPSPLASPLAAGQQPSPMQSPPPDQGAVAPAAGVASQFGKQAV